MLSLLFLAWTSLAAAADLAPSYTFTDARSLWIESMAGDIAVIGGGESVSVLATPGQWDSGCSVSVSEGSAAHLEVERRRRRLSCELALQVMVPDDARLRLEVGQGSVSLADVAGPVDALVAQGDVRLAGVSGSVYASVAEGTVAGTLDGGSLSAVVAQGAVDVQFSAAPSGPVSVTVAQGDASVALPAETPVLAALDGETVESDFAARAPSADGVQVRLQARRGAVRLQAR